jgi:hypothetical protein
VSIAIVTGTLALPHQPVLPVHNQPGTEWHGARHLSASTFWLPTGVSSTFSIPLPMTIEDRTSIGEVWVLIMTDEHTALTALHLGVGDRLVATDDSPKIATSDGEPVRASLALTSPTVLEPIDGGLSLTVLFNVLDIPIDHGQVTFLGAGVVYGVIL